MIFKRKKHTPALPVKPPKKITLSNQEFIDMVIAYESGQSNGEDMLILFSYIVENEKYERYLYDHLNELLNFGVIEDDGMINPLKLKEYKSK